MAASIVTLTKKRDHIKPALKDPHWLPVKELIFITRFFHWHAHAVFAYSQYLQELIPHYDPP